MLRFCGYDAVTATSPAQAIELAGSYPGIAAVITDASMRALNGPALAARLRRQRPALPILFISGTAAETDVASAPQPWVFLDKPFTPEELGQALERLLQISY
jgi:two-component system cell cycle sensor histidine kinase/response regulator CckA